MISNAKNGLAAPGVSVTADGIDLAKTYLVTAVDDVAEQVDVVTYGGKIVKWNDVTTWSGPASSATLSIPGARVIHD